MSHTTKIMAGLDDIDKTIRAERQLCTNQKARYSTAAANLTAMPTNFAAIKSVIDAYTPTGALETMAKDRLAKAIAEYTLLVADIETAITGLSSLEEF